MAVLVVVAVFAVNMDMRMGVRMLMGMDDIAVMMFMSVGMGMFVGMLQFDGVLDHEIHANAVNFRYKKREFRTFLVIPLNRVENLQKKQHHSAKAAII